MLYLEAKKPLRFTITEEIKKKAARADKNFCPIAQGVHASLPDAFCVEVGSSFVTVVTTGKATRYALGPRVSQCRASFDDTGEWGPAGEYQLDRVPKSHHRATKRVNGEKHKAKHKARAKARRAGAPLIKKGA